MHVPLGEGHALGTSAVWSASTVERTVKVKLHLDDVHWYCRSASRTRAAPVRITVPGTCTNRPMSVARMLDTFALLYSGTPGRCDSRA